MTTPTPAPAPMTADELARLKKLADEDYDAWSVTREYIDRLEEACRTLRMPDKSKDEGQAADCVQRLINACIDWNGTDMVDGEPPRDILRCRDLREVVLLFGTLTARVAELEQRERELSEMVTAADESRRSANTIA